MGMFDDDLVVKLRTDITEFSTGLEAAANQTKRWAEGIERQMSSLGASMTRAGTVMTGALTLPLAALGAASIKAAADMDSLTRGLAAVSKTGGTVEQQLIRLKEVAKLPGLGFQEAVQGSIRLQAAGMSAQTAERALMGFGNALATVGKGRVDLEGVIMALTQIAAKGKVSAEEINQLAERLPQIREAMKNAFGTADTEVLQKMGIDAKSFIATLITEFEKLPAVTTGIKNDFENFSDAVQQTFAEIGKALLPFASTVLQSLQPLLVWLKDAGAAFAALPAPVQTFTIAVGVALAALGPLTFGIGQTVAGIGGLIGAFGKLAPMAASAASGIANFAASIGSSLTGAATTGSAALAALGAAAAATAIAIGAIAAVKLVDAFQSYKQANQEAADATVGFANACVKLRDSLAAQGVTVNKLAGESWDAYLKRLQEAAIKQGDLVKATKGSADALAGLNDVQRKIAESLMKTGLSADQAKAAVAGLAGSHKAAGDAAAEHGEKLKKLDVELLNYQAALARAAVSVKDAAASHSMWLDAFPEMVAETIAFTASLDAMGAEMLDVSKVPLPAFLDSLPNSLKASKAAIDELNEAFKSVGKVNETTLRDAAEKSQRYFEQIRDSGVATVLELNQAFVNSEQDIINWKRALGEPIDESWAAALKQMQADIDAAAGKTETATGKMKDAWAGLGKEVLKYTRQLSASLADVIFAGKGLAETFKTIAIDIAKSITQYLINGAINDLLKSIGLIGSESAKSGASLSGLLKKIGLGGGDKTPSVPTPTPSTPTPDVGGVGGASGGAGSGAGSVAGAIGSSLTGWITAISSGVSAITDIIGLFRSPLSKDLGRVEENTRACKEQLIHIQDTINQYLPTLDSIREVLWVPVLEYLRQLTDKIVWGSGEGSQPSQSESGDTQESTGSASGETVPATTAETPAPTTDSGSIPENVAATSVLVNLPRGSYLDPEARKWVVPETSTATVPSDATATTYEGQPLLTSWYQDWLANTKEQAANSGIADQVNALSGQWENAAVKTDDLSKALGKAVESTWALTAEYQTWLSNVKSQAAANGIADQTNARSGIWAPAAVRSDALSQYLGQTATTTQFSPSADYQTWLAKIKEQAAANGIADQTNTISGLWAPAAAIVPTHPEWLPPGITSADLMGQMNGWNASYWERAPVSLTDANGNPYTSYETPPLSTGGSPYVSGTSPITLYGDITIVTPETDAAKLLAAVQTAVDQKYGRRY